MWYLTDNFLIKPLDKIEFKCYYNKAVLNSYALLAQLDRVFGYEPKGQGFESLAARQ